MRGYAAADAHADGGDLRVARPYADGPAAAACAVNAEMGEGADYGALYAGDIIPDAAS